MGHLEIKILKSTMYEVKINSLDIFDCSQLFYGRVGISYGVFEIPILRTTKKPKTSHIRTSCFIKTTSFALLHQHVLPAKKS